MKQNEVIIGLILIIVGVIVFFMSDSFYNPYNPFITSFSSFMRLLGIIMLIAGTIISIAGAASSPVVPSSTPDEVKCEECGIPKGNRHFYVVKTKNKSVTVCDQCVEKYRKENELKNKAIGQTLYNDAFSILKTRYAKGEITKEQFEQMKKDLEKLEK